MAILGSAIAMHHFYSLNVIQWPLRANKDLAARTKSLYVLLYSHYFWYFKISFKNRFPNYVDPGIEIQTKHDFLRKAVSLE